MGHFEPLWCETIHKSWKTQKKLLVLINWDSAEIFKFPSVLIIAYHSLDSFWPAQKNEPCSEGSVKIGQDSAQIFKFLLTFNQNYTFWANPSHFGGKISHCGSFWVMNQVKLAIPSQSKPHFEKKSWKNLQNDQNWSFGASLSHFFGKICHWGSFWATPVWNDSKKLKNSKYLLIYLAQEWKIFEISPKMRHFGGKRWEKLWIGWNWPFQVNLSLILGEKMDKPAKWWKLAFWSQSKSLFWQNLPLRVILSHSSVNDSNKLKNSKYLPMYPPPQEWKFLRFLQIWDALVPKDGKSCE